MKAKRLEIGTGGSSVGGTVWRCYVWGSWLTLNYHYIPPSRFTMLPLLHSIPFHLNDDESPLLRLQ
uniref:Uncharacterized protein n=1 Tax=Manihot esculenta TaxID=3983 RepID=A0A251KUB6_MANES